MAIDIRFDSIGNPELPTIILANRSGNKFGQLDVNADSVDISDIFSDISEFSFTINKYVDDKITPLWEKIVDFKLVYCKEWDMWFEIKVELDEATETVKTVFCTQLGQAELSQIMLYNIEINTEADIERDDYKISILYDEDNPKASILHRILEKAPHYAIEYVDPTIARIQRQFSFDSTSICDAFSEIGEEIGCLFVYNSNSDKNGVPKRTISVYDLQQNCNDCNYRGEFTDKCPKCGSTNITYGYGEDTTIFVTSDELATEGIQLVTDTDSVKNCFKLEAGDDLMTATIRNCNPNGSDYIWYFSDAVKEDMSDELVKRIEGYDEQYKEYYNSKEYTLDENLVNQYNDLVEKYKNYYNTPSTCLNCDYEGEFENECPSCHSKNILTGKRLQTIPMTTIGYSALMNAYYNTIDLALYLESSLMPNIEMSETHAEDQVRLLTPSSLSPVAVNIEDIKNVSLATANSAVLSMAKIIVRPTYKVEIKTSTLSEDNIWSGQFIVTNYSDDTDTAIGDTIDVVINNNTEEFIKQKIEKALNKENTDDYSITGLFAKEYDEFCKELKKYALNPLKSFYDACDVCLNILIDQGAGDEDKKPDLYEGLYKPYYNKSVALANEIKVREDEIAIIEGVYDETDENNKVLIIGGLQTNIANCQNEIQKALDFESYLGKDLWLEFCSYRREDKYSNENYISDGLNNAELFQKANEFIKVAEDEIFKSAELQHSISTTLNNLLAIPKFKKIVKSFKTGNWIRVQVDDKVYKLRLLKYEISYGDFNNIPVEFSDIIKIKNGITDVKDILSQASSMASSYDSVQRQAKKGDVARSTIDQWLVDGLNAANVQIQSNDSEEVLLTKGGLLARSYDDITETYSPEQLKITHNIMAYTDNNWETVRQAIGKHNYKVFDEESKNFVDKEGYGVSADFVTAGVVSGSQIIGGDVYSDNYSTTNRTGSYLNLRDGTFSFGGGSLRFEKDEDGNAQLLISSPDILTKNEVTTINEEYLKTTSVYAENLQVKAANIQEQLTAKQINTVGLIAENISATTIEGKTILGGDLFIGDENNTYAEITSDGVLNCYGANIIGNITATDGSIGGWIIKEDYLRSPNESLWLFSNNDGGGTINGQILNNITLRLGKHGTNAKLALTNDGELYASDVNLSGCIEATSGVIGGFTIGTDGNDDNYLYSGTFGENNSVFLSTSDMEGVEGFFDGENITDWRMTVGSNFGVTSDGSLYANDADIAGNIIARSGVIGGLEILPQNTIPMTYISYYDNSGETMRPTKITIDYLTVGTTIVDFTSTAYDYFFEYDYWVYNCSFGVSNVKYGDNKPADIIEWVDETQANFIEAAPNQYLWVQITMDFYKEGNIDSSRTETFYRCLGTSTCTVVGYRDSLKITPTGIYFYKPNEELEIGSISWLDNGSAENSAIFLAGTWKGESGIITQSSRIYKTEIASLNDAHSVLFDNLIPREYEYKNQHGRKHYGFILDELGDAFSAAGLTSTDCAAYCLDNPSDPDGSGGIRYEEMIALCVNEIQKLKSRVEKLER